VSTKKFSYVVCVEAGDREDLEVRKLYEVWPDEAANARGYLRVIDESGEDYLYPKDWFIPVEVPREGHAALTAAATGRVAADQANKPLQRTAPTRRR